MKARYFAWVREQIGRSEEEIAPPPSVATVAELITWLKQRGENYAAAFADAASIRAALDRRHVKPEASLAGATEVAFFPPMTGG
jgi:sulfur-carrier protein